MKHIFSSLIRLNITANVRMSSRYLFDGLSYYSAALLLLSCHAQDAPEEEEASLLLFRALSRCTLDLSQLFSRHLHVTCVYAL